MKDKLYYLSVTTVIHNKQTNECSSGSSEYDHSLGSRSVKKREVHKTTTARL